MRSHRLLPVLLLMGCGGESEVFAPVEGSPVVAEAAILIGGVRVDGRTISPGSGRSTLFQAHLSDPQGLADLTGVFMVFHRPMGMMGQAAPDTLWLCDDGTHGDPMAGDGRYHHEDFTGEAGMHMREAMAGHYQYTFHGRDRQGHHSRPLTLEVGVAR